MKTKTPHLLRIQFFTMKHMLRQVTTHFQIKIINNFIKTMVFKIFLQVNETYHPQKLEFYLANFLSD